MNVSLEELTAWLQQQRWFGGKGVPISRVEVMEGLTLPSSAGLRAEASVVQVSYLLGSPERYLVFLERGPDGLLRDGLEDPAVARAVLAFACEGGQLSVGNQTVRAELIGDGEATLAALPSEPAVRFLGVEQSNTSLVFAEQVLLKIVRKLEVGPSPEAEMGRFLATHQFRATPQLLATVTLQGATAGTIALAYPFLPNQGDGWEYVTSALRANPKPTAALLAELEDLGARVGEMHRILASDSGDPGFSPEPILQEDLQRWSSSIVGELGVTLARSGDRFPALTARQDALTDRAKALAFLTPSGQKIRQHGDLHLGQALRTAGGWMIIDFEGEPARAYTARREKHTPLRDVAGMLRSFSYAVAAVQLPSARWRQAVESTRGAFYRGWRRAVDPARLLPARETDCQVMLDVLELEKTLYELRYELQMRPDWAHIPAEALA